MSEYCTCATACVAVHLLLRIFQRTPMYEPQLYEFINHEEMRNEDQGCCDALALA